ncbi:MAG: nuclear transport factor 2 family protein [Anaerolineales bacterium]|nr:nuclear transport factor 2 family protein [Anaerolineales bacterium]
MKTTVEPLTVERFRELWSKTYNTEGKPDWSHIFPYYHEDIIFEDSIQRIEGIEEFTAMCERLTSRCEQLSMEIISVATNPNEIFFQWKMVMMFKKFPSTPLYGCSKLTLGDDNRIIEQRDYYDLWGDIFNGIHYFKKPYRNFLKKYFG